VNRKLKNSIPEIVARLDQNKMVSHSAFLGFDACIDNIVRIVKEKNSSKGTEFFRNSNQFGDFLKDLDNKSCGVELQTKLSKIGGNMVITGNALGNLGVSVECVGTFGIPEILPVFRAMSDNCSLHTVGDTISATALEFIDSKVIIFDPGPYIELKWESIKTKLGIDKIKELISGKKLVSFLNWSEIENSSEIWQGVLTEILPSLIPAESEQYFFSDFSDCSRRSTKEIQFALDLLGRFRKYFKVVLSVNRNEAELIASAIGVPVSNSDSEFIRSIFEAINVDILTIHQTLDALAFDGVNLDQCKTFLSKEPAILTGGGDNFNAGFCYALFSKFDIYQSLLVANAVAGYYVKTGLSPSRYDLIDFLNRYII